MFDDNIKFTLCRTCLQNLTQTKVFHIFNTLDLAKKIMLCSTLPVEANDEYPVNICHQCYEQILIFYDFQQLCCKSLDTYNELIKARLECKETVCNEQTEIDAKDPLKEDIKEIYLLEEKSNELLDNVEICNDLYEKKKQGRPYKKSKIKNQAKFKESDKRELKQGATIKLKDELHFKEQDHHDSSFNCFKGNETCEMDENATIEINVEVEDIFIQERSFSDTDSNSSMPQFSFSKKHKYQCDRCSETFTIQHRLEAHKREHDGLAPYTCNIEGCERNFNCWSFFSKHQKDHKPTQGQIFKCDLENCERSYKNKSALNIHKRKCHHVGPELKSHMCEICGKVFKSSAVLNDHRYTHIVKTQLPYACEETGCTKRFSNKDKLRVHKMRHEGVKNFSCPYCGLRKTTKNELKIHINYHTLERTWPCLFCPKVFNSAGNLKTHVKCVHERAKDFACCFCERTFAKADTKKYHEMTHTGEKPHECEECGRRFVQPAALRTHRKVHVRQKAREREKNAKVSKDVESTKEVGDEEATLLGVSIVAEVLSDTSENLE